MLITPVDYRAPDAAKQFAESLHRTGFGVLTNHPLSQSLLETIYQEWYAFFKVKKNINMRLIHKNLMVISRRKYQKRQRALASVI